MFHRPSTPQLSSTHFEWTIDEMSSLNPASFEAHETQFTSTTDPDVEAKAQAAISSFFREQVIGKWISKLVYSLTFSIDWHFCFLIFISSSQSCRLSIKESKNYSIRRAISFAEKYSWRNMPDWTITATEFTQRYRRSPKAIF